VSVSSESTLFLLLMYSKRTLTANASNIKKPLNFSLLIVAIVLIPCFVLWIDHQESRGLPTIIPNSIWRKAGFTSVCISVFLTWSMFNAFIFFSSLLLQEIQHVSALQTSIKFLPLVTMSVGTNFVVGYLVDKVPASTLALGACLLTAVAPILLAVLSPKWSYWAAIFPAMTLSPISSDILFNVSNLVITASFSSNDQAVAGGVFSMVSQLGNSIGLAVAAAIASSVTATAMKGSQLPDPEAMLKGYRAVWWSCFGAAVASCLISTLGLRKSGKVGLKRD
jgi:MFS family permease